jgi:cyclophilin family peptidyl-prolyl cis-trans isomerase
MNTCLFAACGRTSQEHISALEPRRLFAVTLLDDISDITVDVNHPATVIDLSSRFDETNITGSVARFDSVLGTIYAEMFDTATPVTVTNFFRYADANLWDNSIIHRSVANFVVQGGGFQNSLPNEPASIQTFPAIQNEFGISNTRGTIAMAKLGGDPNSATSQWFFNLSDSNAANLDNQNGGFTVFARVIGNGMSVVNAIAAVPVFNFGGAFNEIPLRNYTSGPPAPENAVSFSDISRASEVIYTIQVGNPALVTTSVVNGRLTLTYAAGQSGTTTVTVRATSVADSSAFVEDQFTVTIADVPTGTPAATLNAIAVSDTPSNVANTKMFASFRISNSASVDASSIGSGDVVLVGPNGFWQPGTLIGLPEQQTHSFLVTCEFPARLGTWDSSDNGDYALVFLANSINLQGGGSMAASTPWSNFMWFNAPTAERVSESVTDGSTFMDVTVLYRDFASTGTAGISWGSIGDGDVTLSKGIVVLSGSLLTRSIPATGQLLATYRFAAPGGYWDQSDNGTWTLATVSGAVWDNQGFVVAALNLRSYGLFFSTPSARVTNYVADPNSTAATITVQYQALGTGLMSWDSIGEGDIELRGPNGLVTIASLLSVTASQSNGIYTYTAVYSIAAPGGTWNSADNGQYAIWTRSNQVFDAAGRLVPSVELDSRFLFY